MMTVNIYPYIFHFKLHQEDYYKWIINIMRWAMPKMDKYIVRLPQCIGRELSPQPSLKNVHICHWVPVSLILWRIGLIWLLLISFSSHLTWDGCSINSNDSIAVRMVHHNDNIQKIRDTNFNMLSSFRLGDTPDFSVLFSLFVLRNHFW